MIKLYSHATQASGLVLPGWIRTVSGSGIPRKDKAWNGLAHLPCLPPNNGAMFQMCNGRS
jgi:hypothetical protein